MDGRKSQSMKKNTGKSGEESKDPITVYFETLKLESERGKIILLASKIDELLSQLLKTLFKPCRGKKADEDKLFRAMGPLATFSSRIEMAYRVGLISRTSADCFDVLREISNDCAHKMAPFSYESGIHSQKFEKFKKLSFTVSGMEQFCELVECADAAHGSHSKEAILFLLTIIHILLLQNTLAGLKTIGDSFSNLENTDIWNHYLLTRVSQKLQ